MIRKKYDLIYFIGDSFTVGCGQSDDIHNEITEQNRFSNLIGSYYNLPIINNALAGCGNYYIFRNLYKDLYELVSQNKRPLVITSYTGSERIEVFSEARNCRITMTDEFSYYKDYMLESYNKENCDEIMLELILANHTLLKLFNIDYVEAFVFVENIVVPYAYENRCLTKSLINIAGTDGNFGGKFKNCAHPNILGHQRIANEFIIKIEELYGSRQSIK